MDTIETSSYMEYAMNNQNHKGIANGSSNESMKSCGKEVVRDSRISDLEEKLAVAEDRCSVLRKQVAYMKMLYTSSNHQPTISDEDTNKKIDENLHTTMSNPMCYRAEVDSNYKSAPANMALKSLTGTSLTEDPKEAMQLIVNEMTQSVNAVEGTVNIHSVSIEGINLTTRNKKRRTVKKDDWHIQRVKKNPQPPLQRETSRPANDKLPVPKRSMRSLGSRSKSGSLKFGKKRQLAKTVGGTRNRTVSRKNSDLRVREKPHKKDKGCKEPKSPEEGTPIGMVPKVTSSTYLLPTLSYRMKCVPKSYRPQFSFHRIPFVLGKSINKSHNIGAKIQETLSLIKLSRKGPVSGVAKKEELTSILQPRSATDSQPPPLLGDQSVTRVTGSHHNKQRGPMTVGASTDYKNYQLRTVLMNLHDEFSKMTENYEVLKASLKEKYDPEVAQQAQNLEDELNAKEIEINAFMNLYNEVSQLKDRLSSSRVGSHPSAMYRPTSSSITETPSSLKMTRLLRRIEQFQDQLKNMAYL